MAGDPYFEEVVLLLHCDGSDGGTTFTDHSKHGHSVSTRVFVTTEVEEKKFGTASLYDDGTGYLDFGSDSSFIVGTDPFTVEAWIHIDSSELVSDASYTIFDFGTASGTKYVSCFVSYHSVLGYTLIFITLGAGAPKFAAVPVSDIGDAWHHVAFVRDTDELRIYLDGTEEVVETATPDDIDTSAFLMVGGAYGPVAEWEGYIDDVRFTNGIARYDGNFSVPTEAFPDDRSLTVETGAFTLTGSAAGLFHNFDLIAETGSFTLTGQDAVISPVFALEPGVFSLSGPATSLLYNRLITPETGTFTLTGSDIGVYWQLLTSVGEFTLTGQAAPLIFQHRLPAIPGTFTLSGPAVTLLYDEYDGSECSLSATLEIRTFEKFRRLSALAAFEQRTLTTLELGRTLYTPPTRSDIKKC